MERTGANRLTDAATSTLNLVVAGSTAVLAAALQSLPLLGLGAAAYVALVAWDLTTRRREPAFAGLPAAEKLSDPDAKRSVLALQAAHRELEAVLEKSPDQIARYLDMALGTASELEDRAGRLAHGVHALRRMLEEDSSQRGCTFAMVRFAVSSEQTPDHNAEPRLNVAPDRLHLVVTLAELDIVVDALRSVGNVELALRLRPGNKLRGKQRPRGGREEADVRPPSRGRRRRAVGTVERRGLEARALKQRVR